MYLLTCFFCVQVNALCGVGKVNVTTRNSFPSFPQHYIPGREHLTSMFVKDYWENKSYMMRELRNIVTCHSLAVDHQRKVVKRTRGGEVVGRGGQTFTICGDFGLICGIYVVPDTGLSWASKAMTEVVDRHEAAGLDTPKYLYMDCGCCNGKANYKRPVLSSESEFGTTASLWRAIFSVKLDSMHMMLRIGRERAPTEKEVLDRP